MRRADRLLRIVHFLRSRRCAVTAQCIADEFGVCRRTVYRDIQDLIYSGAPIIGEAGVGYIIDKEYYLPPVTFDVDELEAIGLGISMVRQSTDENFALKARNALEKIQAILPAKMQGEIQQATTFSMPSASGTPRVVRFSDIRQAIQNRCKIRMTYQDKVQRQTVRMVQPLALFFFSPVWLLTCWCEKRNDFRNFRLDRIQAITFCAETFADDADKNLAAFKAKVSCL